MPYPRYHSSSGYTLLFICSVAFSRLCFTSFSWSCIILSLVLRVPVTLVLPKAWPSPEGLCTCQLTPKHQLYIDLSITYVKEGFPKLQNLGKFLCYEVSVNYTSFIQNTYLSIYLNIYKCACMINDFLPTVIYIIIQSRDQFSFPYPFISSTQHNVWHIPCVE